MQTRPNRTDVRAMLRSFSPSPDGRGGDLELQILSNDSRSPEDDFIRPEVGGVIQAFTPETPDVPIGSEVDVRLTFLGGPKGGRAVVQRIAKGKRK